MSSVVAICNLALSNIGKSNITDLNEASPEARACRQFYEQSRDVLLESFPWRFARKTESLAEVANDKPRLWLHAYKRPTGCLKVICVASDPTDVDAQISDGSEIRNRRNPYSVEGDLIYCNLKPAFLVYTQRLADPTRFSASFRDALSWHLAVRLAMPLTRDPKVRADAWQVAQETTAAARMLDANEVPETSDNPSELVEVR